MQNTIQTSQRQILQNGEVKLMFLAEDSHAWTKYIIKTYMLLNGHT